LSAPQRVRFANQLPGASTMSLKDLKIRFDSHSAAARKALCVSSNFAGAPSEAALTRPSGPFSLNWITYSRSVWRSMPHETSLRRFLPRRAIEHHRDRQKRKHRRGEDMTYRDTELFWERWYCAPANYKEQTRPVRRDHPGMCNGASLVRDESSPHGNCSGAQGPPADTAMTGASRRANPSLRRLWDHK
jgi:hypothetical protein